MLAPAEQRDKRGGALLPSRRNRGAHEMTSNHRASPSDRCARSLKQMKALWIIASTCLVGAPCPCLEVHVSSWQHPSPPSTAQQQKFIS